MKKFIYLISLFVISQNILSSDLDREVTENYPEAGKAIDAYLGDQILVNKIGIYRDCIVPNFNFEKYNLSVVAGKPICRESERSDTYYSTYANDNTRRNGAPGKRRIVFTNKNGKIKFKFHRTRLSIDDLKESDFDIGKTFIPSENSMQRFIEYAGKKENILSFNYGEFQNLPSNAVIREFKVDLDEGTVGAYKGAIFEILEATNATIKYKIIRHFPETR